MSFVPEHFRDFFGDWYCDNSKNFCQYGLEVRHASTWHWGFRHFVWCAMGLTLFIYNVVIIIDEKL